MVRMTEAPAPDQAPVPAPVPAPAPVPFPHPARGIMYEKADGLQPDEHGYVKMAYPPRTKVMDWRKPTEKQRPEIRIAELPMVDGGVVLPKLFASVPLNKDPEAMLFPVPLTKEEKKAARTAQAARTEEQVSADGRSKLALEREMQLRAIRVKTKFLKRKFGFRTSFWVTAGL